MDGWMDNTKLYRICVYYKFSIMKTPKRKFKYRKNAQLCPINLNFEALIIQPEPGTEKL